jgi:hypothetical protein
MGQDDKMPDTTEKTRITTTDSHDDGMTTTSDYNNDNSIEVGGSQQDTPRKTR